MGEKEYNARGGLELPSRAPGRTDGTAGKPCWEHPPSAALPEGAGAFCCGHSSSMLHGLLISLFPCCCPYEMFSFHSFPRSTSREVDLSTGGIVSKAVYCEPLGDVNGIEL